MDGVTPSVELHKNVTADDVLRAHFTLSSLKGAIECIDLDGASGWTSPNPHPALSLMHWTTDDRETAATSLDTVLDRFRKEGRSLEWMTGPECDAAGLVSLLGERGFNSEPMHIAAMSKTLGPMDIDNGVEGVRTFKVEEKNCEDMGRVMARGFSVPDDVGVAFHRAYVTDTDSQSSDVYAAFLDGKVDAAGVGYLTYLGESNNALLRASSVLEPARGRGAYKALVQHRLQDAATQGCDEIFVHAYSKGSRECLTNLGFRTLGGLSLYVWSPD